MRVVENRIIDAISKRNAPIGTEVTLSKRDFVRYEPNNTVVYTLWSSDIAIITEDEITLGTITGGYQTNTTKSRLNALASQFVDGVCYISQKNWRWSWSDGEPYTGRRTFKRRP